MCDVVFKYGLKKIKKDQKYNKYNKYNKNKIQLNYVK